jgi:glutamate dehydrogenase/leucine dehydrogenase
MAEAPKCPYCNKPYRKIEVKIEVEDTNPHQPGAWAWRGVCPYCHGLLKGEIRLIPRSELEKAKT